MGSLVAAANEASSAGEIDRALQLLETAATHFWWADPASECRRHIVAALRRVPAPKNDPRVLSILEIADPAGHTTVLGEVASRTSPDTCDPKTAHSLGTALHMTGALELSATFLAVAEHEDCASKEGCGCFLRCAPSKHESGLHRRAGYRTGSR